MSIIVARTGWQENQLKSQKKKQLYYWQNMTFLLYWMHVSWTWSHGHWALHLTLKGRDNYKVFTLINRHIGTLWSITPLWTHRSCKVWAGMFQDRDDDAVYTEPSHYDHCVQYQLQIDMANIVLQCTFGSTSRICPDITQQTSCLMCHLYLLSAGVSVYLTCSMSHTSVRTGKFHCSILLSCESDNWVMSK